MNPIAGLAQYLDKLERRLRLFAWTRGAAATFTVALLVPLLRMNRRRAANEVERKHPGFDQRLLTFTEKQRDNADDPFLPLLAEDALDMTRNAQPEVIVDQRRMI